jgi:hypothetical protein
MHRVAVRLVVLALSLALSLSVAEYLLRRSGLGPWPHGRKVPRNEPVFHVPDEVLGWRSMPGHYLFDPYAPGGSKIRMTIEADGSRATSDGQTTRGREVLLVGCSFTFGQALSDEETLGWQLQQLLPGATVKNFAVSGYGTLQALLLLEERLRDGRPQPIVVYGFADAHEIRNVAQPLWIRLLAVASRKGMVALPFATLDADGQLVRHPPLHHPMWPLRRTLAVVSVLQDRITDLIAAGRVRQAPVITERLLVEMNDRVARTGGKLLVAMLYGWTPVMESYEKFLAKQGIGFVDCLPAELPLPLSLLVPGEGHPNGVVNGRWAQCIARELRREFPDLAGKEAPSE